MTKTKDQMIKGIEKFITAKLKNMPKHKYKEFVHNKRLYQVSIIYSESSDDWVVGVMDMQFCIAVIEHVKNYDEAVALYDLFN
jgi:hypothetical protein